MASKTTAPTKKQQADRRALAESPEQRTGFRNALALLPEGEQALLEHAGMRLAQYNDARQCEDVAAMEAAELFYWAAVWRLNGDTGFGCETPKGGLTRVQQHLAAAPGVPTMWGQLGSWLLEVDGMRMHVRVGYANTLGGRHGVDLRAVDPDAPFLSAYGLLNVQMWPDDYPGLDFVRALRAKVESLLSDGQPPVAIVQEYREGLALPDWLAPALEGPAADGQQALALSGRAPLELPPAQPAEPKAPLSNAERQKAFRERQKRAREQAQADGLVSLELTRRDRAILANALDYYDFQHPHSNDFEKLGMLELYKRLQPAQRGAKSWPADEDREAWYARQMWHVVCEGHKAKQAKSDAALIEARAEIERLQGLLVDITSELGIQMPQIDSPKLAAAVPVPVEAAEPLSLQLLRRHKWHGGREEDVALVAVQVVPHEGQWMWSACLSSQNGSGYHYAPLARWGRFAATPGDALARALEEVRAFRERMTTAERKRLDAWLAGEAAERLAQLGGDLPSLGSESACQQMQMPLADAGEPADA